MEAPLASEFEMIAPGPDAVGPAYPYGHGGACQPCGDGCGYGAGCGGGECYGYGPGYPPCGIGGCHPYPDWWKRDLSINVGVHGFKGPFDHGRNGNFGIHEGANLGISLFAIEQLGAQVGFGAVHSNFEGDQVAGFRTADRNQIFLTTGIFRRALCGGLQWGVVFDLLHDSYIERVDLKQIRAELGFVRPGHREFGFWGAFGTGNDQQGAVDLEPTDLFAFFYRRYLCNGGDARAWAGFTGRGDGLLGADLRLPLGHYCALENRVSYLVPKESQAAGAAQREEAWSLSIQFVWYLGMPASCVRHSPFRPLFDVADNGLFMTDFSR